MEAFDQYGMHAYECSVDGSAMEVAGNGVLSCRAGDHRTDELGAGVLGDGFDIQHRQWGLRGDPHVWAALRQETAAVLTPANTAGIRQAFIEALRRVADVDLDGEEHGPVRREKFAHGGMSSGLVDLDWWRDKGLPLLVDRAAARRPAASERP